jgi:ribosomal protein L11 methyltransferase
MPARYWELTVTVPDRASEGLTNFVWEMGALGVVEEETPGSAPRLRAFFPDTADADAVTAHLQRYVASLRELGFSGEGRTAVLPVTDEDWAEAWRAHFRPITVGRSLVIAPPWETPDGEGRLVIEIEPGRAFGTGQHGSTSGCLQLLEDALARGAVARVVDIGTGSGILAITAARLGVPSVQALDDDPDAVAAAIANAARNAVADRVRCVLADVAVASIEPAPLVIANLLAAAHRALARRYAGCVEPGGALILGGLLDREAPATTAAVAAEGFEPRATVSVEGWTSVELTRAAVHLRA